MAEYRLPSLGADMDEATLVEWKIGPGDAVAKGQVVALVETSKSVMDIEFFESGVIEEILVPVGETVAVGAPIARYRAAARVGVAVPAAVAAPPAAPSPFTPAQPVAATAEVVAAVAPTEAVRVPVRYRRIHPPVRHLAERLGIDLAGVTGTGPGGTILKADVRAAAARREAPTVARVGRVSPRARRLALEHGIDLSAAVGSGPDGAITSEDVERLIAGPAALEAEPAGPSAAAPAPAPEVGPPGVEADAQRAAARRLAMRLSIAELMARSKREIPHYYLDIQVDMTRSLTWLEAENLERPMPKRLLPAVLLIKAVALAVHDVPEMNGLWVDGRFQPSEAVHTGIAISLREGGLIAPAIHDADRKTLDELMVALRDLVTRTRSGILHRTEMTDPTITVTNLGDQGVDAVYGVIYPPQVALVGFGRIAERPWAEGGMVGARRVLTATLSADHRASDGHRGGVFLAAIDRRLQEPDKL